LSISPDDERARWGLGVALSRLGRREESVQVMLTLAERSPLSPQARAVAPALEIWAGERMAARASAEAQRGYQAVLETGQVTPELFLNLGLLLWQSGQKAETLSVLDRGAARYPESADLAYRRGRVLQQLGRGAEGEGELRRALRLAPGHGGATAALEGR
jgi:Flp pilus assembly protein TadD